MRTQLGSMLGYDLDNFNADSSGAVTAAQLTDQINFAIRIVGKRLMLYDPVVTMTPVAGTMSYSLRGNSFSRKIYEAKKVMINGNWLARADGKNYGLWATGEIDRLRPTWPTDSADKPTKAWQINDLLWLHPKPTQAVVDAGNNFVSGLYIPADLTNGTDDSNYADIPEECHEAVVKIAAIFAADPNVTEDECLQRLQRYEARASNEINIIRQRNARLIQDWGSTSGYAYPNFTIN